MRQKAISILGMHRSGTSAIARAINLLGAYIAREDQLMPARKDNPDGFWEHMAIYSFHQRLLKFLSRSWDSLFPMPDEWWKKPEIKPYQEELIGIIEKEFGEQALWLWKDPRTSLLLPLWKDILQELDIDVCYLHCLRNPLDAAASLKKRNGFSKSKSFALWLLYTASACYWTNGKKRMVVHFDHLLADWEESLRKVSIAFDLPWPQDDQPLRKAMADFIRLSSRHSYSSLDSLLNDKTVPEDVLLLYRLLLDCEKDQGFFESTEFEEYILKLFARYKERAYPSPLQSPQSLSEKTSPFEQQKLDELDILHFDRPSNPQVSIIIPAWNQWQYTFCCLRSILENTEDVAYELIIVDDGSTDETTEMLKRVENVKIIRHESNLGYACACNEGARLARGKYLLFLNNDTTVTKGWLKKMVALADADQTVGAVGAKLVFPDGKLQEAGCIVWTDGSVLQYGKGQDASNPAFCYSREVDYCSGACLLVHKKIFVGLGGFDDLYSPAYYEDSDMCFEIRRLGYRVVYHPGAQVIHHESGSSSSEKALECYLKNMPKFVKKWQQVLRSQFLPCEENILLARDKRKGARFLVLCEGFPRSDPPSGYRRIETILRCLAESGYAVTFFLLVNPLPHQPDTEELQQMGIEVIYGEGLVLEQFLTERIHLYDAILIGESPDAFRYLQNLRRFFPSAWIFYDAVSLNLEGESAQSASSDADGIQILEREPWHYADAMIVDTESERKRLTEKGFGNVFVWSDSSEAAMPESEGTKLRFARFIRRELNRRLNQKVDSKVLESREQYISDLRTKISTMEDYIRALREAINEKDVQFSTMQTNIESMITEKDRYIESLVQALKTKEQELQTLRTAVESMMKEKDRYFESLVQAIETKERCLNDLTTFVRTKEEDIKRLIDERDAQEERLQRVTSKLDSLENKSIYRLLKRLKCV